MSFFDQILTAIADPNQPASADGLGSILGAVQQASSQHGVEPDMMQSVVSLLGGAVQSSLQDQQDAHGSDHVMGILNQFSGGGSNTGAMNALFSPDMQQQVAGGISQKTGLDASVILGLLPMLLPVVLNLIQGGGQQGAMGGGMGGGGMTAQPAAAAGNPLLNAFLDRDRSGSVDLGDALNMASQYLQNR
jgi:hypothetical protein